MTDQKPSAPTKPLQMTKERSLRLRFTRFLIRFIGGFFLVQVAWKVDMHDVDNIPRTGPTILLLNHVTYYDTLIGVLAIRFRDAIPLAKIELYKNPFFALVVWGWNAIPIRRHEVDRIALKRCVEVINSKDMLEIAPEGTRHINGLRDPQDGLAMLARTTNAVMVPMGISGTEDFLKNLRHLRRTPIRVNFGKPFRLKSTVTSKQYKQAMQEIMYQLAARIDPHLRGDYTDLSQTTMQMIEYV